MNRSSPRRYREFLQLGIVCLAILGLPALLERSVFSTRAAFDAEPLQRLQQEQPDLVLIGDSMLEASIDERHLEQLTGKTVALVADAGSGSARWYLFLKNYVAASGARPEKVIIFFRDRMLTWPEYRTTGKYRERMEIEMLPEEPLLEKILDPAQSSLSQALRRIYPIQDRQEAVREEIEEKVLDITARDEQRLRENAEELFDWRNMRTTAASDIAEQEEEDAPLLFDPSPAASFLPHMIELASQQRLQLCFVRMKRRPGLDNLRSQNPALRQYISELRQYLEQQGVQFIDLSDDPAITQSMYGQGDHIAEGAMRDFTSLFHARIEQRLP